MSGNIIQLNEDLTVVYNFKQHLHQPESCPARH